MYLETIMLIEVRMRDGYRVISHIWGSKKHSNRITNGQRQDRIRTSLQNSVYQGQRDGD